MKTEFKRTGSVVHELDETTQSMMVELIYKMLTIARDYNIYLSWLLEHIEMTVSNFIPCYTNHRHIVKFVMHDFVKKLRDVRYEDGELPIGIIEEDWNYIKNLSDDMVFKVEIEKREDVDEDDFGYAVKVWENSKLVKRILCDDYLSAVQTFFGEIIEFERAHDYITSSYRPE